jgi:hypothetical protein
MSVIQDVRTGRDYTDIGHRPFWFNVPSRGRQDPGTDIHDTFWWIVKEKRDVNWHTTSVVEPIGAIAEFFPNSPRPDLRKLEIVLVPIMQL